MRRLGVTKVQMGAQSFDDRILELNCRGHGVEETLNACALLRAAGFKIVLHWMPNLMGASPELDREDFGKMWSGGFCPDEIKIYPTQLLREAPLFRYWQDGKYQPYTTQQLIDLIADIKPSIPIYTRVNRIIRDIPANYIQAGSLRSSLRQDVKKELACRGQRCRCIRCREIRGEAVEVDQLILDDYVYHPADAEEHFISYATTDDRLAGYLRLSLPEQAPSTRSDIRAELAKEMPELQGAGYVLLLVAVFVGHGVDDDHVLAFVDHFLEFSRRDQIIAAGGGVPEKLHGFGFLGCFGLELGVEEGEGGAGEQYAGQGQQEGDRLFHAASSLKIEVLMD